MDYCIRIWMEWKECRNIKTETTAMTKVELNEALCRFVLEIRKKDGSEYPPNTVHHICCGIMRYLRTRVSHRSTSSPTAHSAISEKSLIQK